MELCPSNSHNGFGLVQPICSHRFRVLPQFADPTYANSFCQSVESAATDMINKTIRITLRENVLGWGFVLIEQLIKEKPDISLEFLEPNSDIIYRLKMKVRHTLENWTHETIQDYASADAVKHIITIPYHHLDLIFE